MRAAVMIDYFIVDMSTGAGGRTLECVRHASMFRRSSDRLTCGSTARIAREPAAPARSAALENL